MEMPISRLRSLDIKEKEEELLVQEVINEKLQNEPQLDPNKVQFTSSQTDNLTPEKEAELQAKMSGQTSVPPNKKRFCEFCEAKGPIKHQNKCTRNKI